MKAQGNGVMGKLMKIGQSARRITKLKAGGGGEKVIRHLDVAVQLPNEKRMHV